MTAVSTDRNPPVNRITRSQASADPRIVVAGGQLYAVTELAAPPEWP